MEKKAEESVSRKVEEAKMYVNHPISLCKFRACYMYLLYIKYKKIKILLMGKKMKICPLSSSPSRSFEDRLECGTFWSLHLLHELFEFFILFIPLMDGRQQILGFHLPTHNEKLVAEIVQQGARTVCPILEIQHELLQFFLLDSAQLQRLFLPGDDFLVPIFFLHLLNFHLQGWKGKRNSNGRGKLVGYREKEITLGAINLHCSQAQVEEGMFV